MENVKSQLKASQKLLLENLRLRYNTGEFPDISEYQELLYNGGCVFVAHTSIGQFQEAAIQLIQLNRAMLELLEVPMKEGGADVQVLPQVQAAAQVG